MLKACRILLSVLPALVITDAVSAQSTPPAASTVVQNCQQLMNATVPAETGLEAPVIRIVEPGEGEVVYGEQLAVTVETENFEINEEGNHWHIWVDGQLQIMLYGPTAVINVAPGTHEVCAIMADGNHLDQGMPAGIRLTVAQPAAGTPTTTPAVDPEVAATYSQVEEQGISPVLLVALGLAAAIGGWWMGTRLPGKRK
jgi:hypothetical protein